MKNPTILRTASGLSQEDYASLLGISRRMLSKIECGQGSFNSKTLLKVSQLHQCLQEPAITEKDNSHGVSPDCQREQEQYCRCKAVMLSRKLVKFEILTNSYNNVLHALDVLTEQEGINKLQLLKLQQKIIKKLERCGPAACNRLRKQVYLLTAEADYIHRVVNENQIHL